MKTIKVHLLHSQIVKKKCKYEYGDFAKQSSESGHPVA